MCQLNKFSKEKLVELLKNAFNKETVYWTSQRRVYPECDDLVVSSERDEIVAYLLETCEKDYMSLKIETFALAVTLLDRFLASFKVKSKYLECLSVACLFIAAKIKEEDNDIPTASDFLHNCECKCSLSDLMRMELMVLTKFDWCVDDITAVDFLYIFYALVVNACEQLEKSDFLDFLPSLEYKIKQCLCVNDLASIYKPHELAYALLSIQLDNLTTNSNPAQTTGGAYNTEYASSSYDNDQTMGSGEEEQGSKLAVVKVMDDLKSLAKIPHETLDKCKEAIRSQLASIESAKTLYDRYMDEYYFDMARREQQQRQGSSSSSSSSKQFTAYSIPSSLAIIKEEDEEELLEEEEDDDELMSVSPSEIKLGDLPMSYAEILKNQKRRLSDSSIGDCGENSFN